MKLIKPLLLIVIALSGSVAGHGAFGQTTQQRQLDLQRGFKNYQEVIAGRKKLEQLSPQEKQEVFVIVQRVQARSEDGKNPECREARDRAATAATELADRSRKLRNCAEAEDYSEDCSSEFRRVKNAHSEYEDAVSRVSSSCN